MWKYLLNENQHTDVETFTASLLACPLMLKQLDMQSKVQVGVGRGGVWGGVHVKELPERGSDRLRGYMSNMSGHKTRQTKKESGGTRRKKADEGGRCAQQILL